MQKLISSLVALFSVVAICGQNASPETPKLVVGVVIDQLRGDYLELFKHNFGEKGFKRLLKEGLVYDNVSYDFPHPDKASAIATIYTGTNPFFHGIVADKKYDINVSQEIASFSDENFMGNYTNERVSPLPLLVSTLTDELKIASGGSSDVFAFAPDAAQALASGGHAASGCFWIEDFSGKWATSTYYKTKQPIVNKHNRSAESISYKINGITWRPSIAIANYNAFPYTRNLYNFQHYFATNKKDQFRLMKQSPFINTEVREIAEKIVRSASLGTGNYPDFLALTFYAGNYENALDKNYSIEIQDTYYKLDQELAALLETIDKSVGLKNTLLFVVSSGYFNEHEVHPEGLTFAGGDFRPDRCQALLNMYLMAIYGKEQWIKKYYNQQFFFDQKLIENKKIDIEEFQRKAAEFLVQFAGVQDVITSHQLLHGAFNQRIKKYHNGFHKNISGDLILELQPGWRVLSESEKSNPIRNNAILSPAIFFGNHIKPERVERTIDATEIAPSVAYRLRIRAPNASEQGVLKELR